MYLNLNSGAVQIFSSVDYSENEKSNGKKSQVCFLKARLAWSNSKSQNIYPLKKEHYVKV